jgi:hypothetical protein
MKCVQTLGVFDNRGQPNNPKYELGPVIERGDNFYARGAHKLNHTDFVWPCGYFDIC